MARRSNSHINIALPKFIYILELNKISYSSYASYKNPMFIDSNIMKPILSNKAIKII